MLISSLFFLFCSFFTSVSLFLFSLILIVLPYSDFMELLGGINNIFNTGNYGTSCSVSNLGNEPIALNLIGKEVDPFTNSDSRSPLEQMASQLKDYEKVMDINDPEQVAFLKDSKAVLEEMRRNLEAGKTTLEKLNKYISDNKLPQKISQQIEKLRDQGAAWFAITGTEELPSNSLLKTNDRKAIEQDFEAAQNKLNKFLKNASPEEIAKLQSDREAAKQRAQQAEMQQDCIIEVQNTIAVQNTDQAINEANKTAQDNLRADISGLEKKLKDPNLTNEDRQSYEQRIEKMKKAIEFLDKIKDDPEFKKKIWSKLSPEEQERLVEDIKNKKLTEESLQAINIATAAADETQTINEGFFASSKQGMKKMTGMTHEDYYEKYRVQMNLDKSTFIKTNIELQVYSRDSSYDSSSYSSNTANKSDSPNSSTAQEERRQAAINQGLAEPESETKKMLAEQYGLDPSGHKLLIFYLLNNAFVNAYEYAQQHGMASLEESLQETMNRLAFQEVAINPRTDEFLGLTFV